MAELSSFFNVLVRNHIKLGGFSKDTLLHSQYAFKSCLFGILTSYLKNDKIFFISGKLKSPNNILRKTDFDSVLFPYNCNHPY